MRILLVLYATLFFVTCARAEVEEENMNFDVCATAEAAEAVAHETYDIFFNNRTELPVVLPKFIQEGTCTETSIDLNVIEYTETYRLKGYDADVVVVFVANLGYVVTWEEHPPINQCPVVEVEHSRFTVDDNICVRL